MKCQYEPLIHITKADVLMQFNKLGARACKDIASTRALVGEWDRLRKEVREVTGKDVDDDHALSILISAIDDVTRIHTADKQGQSLDDFRNAVVDFSNLMSTSVGGKAKKDDAMQIGAVRGMSDEADAEQEDRQQEDEEAQGNNWETAWALKGGKGPK